MKVVAKEKLEYDAGYLLNGEDVVNNYFLAKEVNSLAEIIERLGPGAEAEVVNVDELDEETKGFFEKLVEKFSGAKAVFEGTKEFEPDTPELDAELKKRKAIAEEIEAKSRYDFITQKYANLLQFCEAKKLVIDPDAMTKERFKMNPLEVTPEMVYKYLKLALSIKVPDCEPKEILHENLPENAAIICIE
jgi:hypothetical protein